MAKAQDDSDLFFETRSVRVVYDEPWSFLRWSGHRRVARAFVLRALPMRDLLLKQATIDATVRANRAIDLVLLCAIALGPRDARHVFHLPAAALERLYDAYREVNLIPSDEESAARSGTSFSTILRRLERHPFNLDREQILELTARQIEARLSEWGTEKVNDLKAEAAIRGV